ncbi:putative transporter [Rhodococcus sp. AW25M09]|uniref:MFS transporter n=1 Tax=Rhodococcus sp. AW25M09 TaxID=1268303 RepID=UPI0002AC45E1|nr:MFS transporter [Rhodococcus sp. AW25M09]CCQ15120.1 putative transporter [Rhodococcus sp. AW25M09]
MTHRRSGSWATLCACLLAVTMQMIDVTAVTVALPTIARDLDGTGAQQVWVPAAYLLAFACALLTMARIGEVFGRRNTFVVGTAMFATTSVLCAYAPTIELLIFARVLQGVAGAAMSAQTVAIVTATYSGSRRTTAFALYGGIAGLAGLAGPSIGAVLMHLDIFGTGWRAIFLINIPIAAIAIAIGHRYVDVGSQYVQSGTGGRFDPVGVMLWSIGALLIVYPIIASSSLLAAVPACGIGLALLAVFAVWERRRRAAGAHVMVDTSVFAERGFSYGCVVSALVYGTFTGFVLTMSVTLQTGLGDSASTVGLITVPFALGAVAASLVAPMSFQRWDSRSVAAGAATMGVALLVLGAATEEMGRASFAWWLAVPLALVGVGLGSVIAPLQSTIVAGVRPDTIGSATGIMPTVQQIGSAVGTAIAGAVYFALLPAQPVASDYLASQQTVLFGLAATMAVATAVAVALPRGDRVPTEVARVPLMAPQRSP